MVHPAPFRPFGSYSGCGPVPEQVTKLLPSAEDIAEHCARTVFASQWGDAIERAHTAQNYPEREESARDLPPEGYDLPNVSGCDLLDIAPHNCAPARFKAYARDLVATAVAYAFLESDGAKILEHWGEQDSAELGHALALDAMGTGADSEDILSEHGAECVPLRDCDGRLYLTLGEVFEPDAPTDNDLSKLKLSNGASLTPDSVQALRQLLDCGDTAHNILDTVAEFLGESAGVESLELPDENDTRLYYVNTGETYQSTLTYDGDRFRVESWGGRLEQCEETRTFDTGETRCSYCSAWGNLLGGEPCAECGHSREE